MAPRLFQLKIQLCLEQVLTLETFLLHRNYITWINLKSLIQQFSDLHTPRTSVAHSFHENVDQEFPSCQETADHIRGNELKDKIILLYFSMEGSF